MIISNCEQMSPEWFEEKAGVPSASHFNEIVTMKGEPSKQREKYLYRLTGELLTGKYSETHTSGAMQRGIDLEPEARNYFEFHTEKEVEQVGMCYPDERKMYSCSPDGIVLANTGEIYPEVEIIKEGLEIKCPLIHTHVEYLFKGKLPSVYFQQVQGSLLVTGFEVWNFMSYYPELKPLIIRVERDEKFIEKLKAELESFCNLLELTVTKLKEGE